MALECNPAALGSLELSLETLYPSRAVETQLSLWSLWTRSKLQPGLTQAVLFLMDAVPWPPTAFDILQRGRQRESQFVRSSY